MEAKVISKENLEKIEELNKMLRFYDLDGNVNKIIGDLLQELGGISYYIYRGKDYVNGINQRLTEMVK